MSRTLSHSGGLQDARPPLAWLEDFRIEAELTADSRYVKRMLGLARRFLWREKIHHIDQLTGAAVGHYLGTLLALGRSRKTVANHRVMISRFCAFLKVQNVLSVNPCTEIKLRKPEEKIPRYLDPDEIRTVLKVARKHKLSVEICVAMSTGLRRAELANLQWIDIDLNRRYLTVRRSKSHKPRSVPLAGCVISALTKQRRKTGAFQYVFAGRQTWPGGWRYVDKQRHKSWWDRALKPIQEAVPKFRDLPGRSTGRGWHLFRHTFASRAAQAGVSIYKLAAWLGHSDVRTTQIYAHLQAGYDKDIEHAAPIQ